MFNILRGTVQDISEFPEVQVGVPKSKDYNRYHISVNLIEGIVDSNNPWITTETIYEKNEPLEFVWSGDRTYCFNTNYYNGIEK